MIEKEKKLLIKKLAPELTVTRNLFLLHTSEKDLHFLKNQIRHINDVINNLEKALKKDDSYRISNSLMRSTYSLSQSRKNEILKLAIQERELLSNSLKLNTKYLQKIKSKKEISLIYSNLLSTPPNHQINLLVTRVFILLEKEGLKPREIEQYLRDNPEILADISPPPSADSIGKRVRSFNKKYSLELKRIKY